jgi:hypothetical protein
MLLYGKHEAVVVQGHRVTIRTRRWGQQLGMIGTDIRKCCDWLEEWGYLQNVQHRYAYIEADLVLPGELKVEGKI